MDSDTGRRLRDRRVRMGVSVRQLADEAGVDRGRLAKLEAGDTSVRETTVGKVSATLARLEQEMGMDDEPVPPVEVEQMTFVVEGQDVTVTVKGAVTDRNAMEESVANIIRSIRESSPRAED